MCFLSRRSRRIRLSLSLWTLVFEFLEFGFFERSGAWLISGVALTGFPELERDLAEAVREARLDGESLQTPIRVCELTRCRGMCCHDGVFVGKEERQVIGELMEGDFFEKREGRWKTRTVTAEKEMLGEGYPAHFPETRCVFLDEQHYCRLQSRALEEGRHPWFWKPFPCWLHPLGFRKDDSSGRRVLSLPRTGQDPAAEEGYPGFTSCTTCGKKDELGAPAAQTLAAELDFLAEVSGRNLRAELAEGA